MTNTTKKPSRGRSLLMAAVVGAVGVYLFGGGLEHKATADLAHIKAQVAADAVGRYDLARRSGGSPTDVCVQAGMVAAAYLQAADESNYRRWKNTERADCARIGVER